MWRIGEVVFLFFLIPISGGAVILLNPTWTHEILVPLARLFLLPYNGFIGALVSASLIPGMTVVGCTVIVYSLVAARIRPYFNYNSLIFLVIYFCVLVIHLLPISHDIALMFPVPLGA